MIAMPIPVPPGTPSWIGIVFVIGAAAVFTVLVWQTVRYFRNSRDED
jgi:hypothetical protein